MLKKRQIKPLVKEISLAFNPANGKKFFMRKEKQMTKEELFALMKEVSVLKTEKEVDTRLAKEADLSKEEVAAVKEAAIIRLAKDKVLEMSKEEKLKIREELKKEVAAELKKEAEKNPPKTDEAAIKLLKDTVADLRKDLDDAKKDAELAKDARRQSEILTELKDMNACGDLEKTSKAIFMTEKIDPQLAKDLLGEQKKTAEMLKAAGIETEVGKGGRGDDTSSDAYAQIMKRQKEVLTKDANISPGKALKKVIQENPDLYKEYTSGRKKGGVQ